MTPREQRRKELLNAKPQRRKDANNFELKGGGKAAGYLIRLF
jgi:hypothetical protein